MTIDTLGKIRKGIGFALQPPYAAPKWVGKWTATVSSRLGSAASVDETLPSKPFSVVLRQRFHRLRTLAPWLQSKSPEMDSNHRFPDCSRRSSAITFGAKNQPRKHLLIWPCHLSPFAFLAGCSAKQKGSGRIGYLLDVGYTMFRPRRRSWFAIPLCPRSLVVRCG